MDGSDSDDYRQEAFRVNINGKEEAELISSEIDSGVNLLNIEDGKVYLYDDFGYLHIMILIQIQSVPMTHFSRFVKPFMMGMSIIILTTECRSITEENVEVYDILKRNMYLFKCPFRIIHYIAWSLERQMKY